MPACHRFRTAFLIALLFLFSCAAPEARTAQSGVLDLRDGFSDGALIRLSGSWEFFWKELLEPGATVERPPTAGGAAPSPATAGQFVSVPGAWNGTVVQGSPIDGIGFASYRLRLLLPPEAVGRLLALRILHFDSAMRLFVDGRPLYTQGVVGPTVHEYSARRRPGWVEFTPASSEVVLLVHVANYSHRNGGFPRPLVFGTAATVQAFVEGNLIFEFLMFGALFIMGVYHLVLFGLRRSDHSPLFFGLFCLLIGLRTLTTGERQFHNWFEDLPWGAVLTLEYITWFLAIPVFVAYVRRIFPRELYTPIETALWIVAGLVSVLVLILPAPTFTYVVQPIEILTVLCGLYLTFVCGLAIVRRRSGSRLFLFCWLILFVTIVQDILYSRHYLQTAYIAPLGLFVFIFSQAVLLSRRFAGAFGRAEQLARELADSEARYRHLIEDAHDAVFSLNESGQILTISRAVHAQLGYIPARLVGRRLTDLVHVPPQSNNLFWQQMLEERIQEIHRSGGRTEFACDFQNNLGEPVELLVRLQRVRQHNGDEIFGSLAARTEDVLLRYCKEEAQRFEITNNLTLSEMLNQRLTSRLLRYLDAEKMQELRLGLREILINAIEHGNLSISFDEKTEATRSGALHRLILERQRDPRFAPRTVYVEFFMNEERAEFLVRDQGSGFDHRSRSLANEEPGDDEPLLHGRGIQMTRLYFDEVSYNEQGNEVRLIKRFA
ncbi:MAG: ATP-binding protein [Spirochaetales bacterium]|nr:ATP-binding protein [Spirochaetales bacterium]